MDKNSVECIDRSHGQHTMFWWTHGSEKTNRQIIKLYVSRCLMGNSKWITKEMVNNSREKEVLRINVHNL